MAHLKQPGIPSLALPERYQLIIVFSLIRFDSYSHSAKETLENRLHLPQTKLQPTVSLKATMVLAPPHTQDSCLRMVNTLSGPTILYLTVFRKLWRSFLACERWQA